MGGWFSWKKAKLSSTAVAVEVEVEAELGNYGHFLCILGLKMTTVEEALPMGPQS